MGIPHLGPVSSSPCPLHGLNASGKKQLQTLRPAHSSFPWWATQTTHALSSYGLDNLFGRLTRDGVVNHKHSTQGQGRR